MVPYAALYLQQGRSLKIRWICWTTVLNDSPSHVEGCVALTTFGSRKVALMLPWIMNTLCGFWMCRWSEPWEMHEKFYEVTNCLYSSDWFLVYINVQFWRKTHAHEHWLCFACTSEHYWRTLDILSPGRSPKIAPSQSVNGRISRCESAASWIVLCIVPTVKCGCYFDAIADYQPNNTYIYM